MVPLRSALRGVCVALAALVLALPAPGLAQISPGHLSRAHAGLEGVRKCTACHEIGGGSEVAPRCRSCHEEIDRSLVAGRGLHGLESWSACSDCHPEHGGREFELIEWPAGWPESFDHARSGWPLEGGHASAKCAACHKPAFQKAALASEIKLQDPSRSFLGLVRECAACHEDRHEGRFGNDCASCHDSSDWKHIRAETFDHSRTRYALEGRHAALECGQCHDPGRAWGRTPAFAHCTDCHADAHAGQATLRGERVDCSACHDLSGFQQTTYRRSWHADSRFPLEGRHADLGCEKCHPGSAAAPAGPGLGRAGVQLRPPSGRCSDCHEDAHAGQFAGRAVGQAGCVACHDVRGFKPASYTVDRHDESVFPLVGAHRRVACATCHGPERALLLPPLPDARVLGSAGAHYAMGVPECASCHRDPHEGRYEAGGARAQEGGCLACHDQESFRPSRVDARRHAELGSPLEGAHRSLPCFECHAELAERGARRLVFDGGRERCVACHDDVHRAQFEPRSDGGACSACHDQESFARAPFFEHERDARFKLRGAHARVACDDCHRVEQGAEGERFVRYRPRAMACRDCHVDP